MIISLVASFIVGGLLGGGVVAWWVHRTKQASVFAENSEVAKELRTEATKAVHARIEKRKARIIEKAKKEGKITNDGIEDMFCISDRTAGRYLRQLTIKGLLTKVGKSGRGVYYTPVE